MRQRVLIAIGMAACPKLPITDEPTPALDMTVQRRILDHLGTLTRDLGIAVLSITHDLGLAAERAEQLVIMHRGCIVEFGPVLDILQHPCYPCTKCLIPIAPSLASACIKSAHAKGINVADEEFIGAGKGSTSTEEIVCAKSLTRELDIRGSRGEAKKLSAVDNVLFALWRGTTFTVVGESGSGRSTAANMVPQFLSPISGIVFFDSQDTSQMNDKELFALRRRPQAAFQSPYGSFDPMFLVFRVIEEPLCAHGYGTLVYAEQEYACAMKTGRDPEEWITTLVDAKKAGRGLSSAERSGFNPKKLRVKRVSGFLDMVALPRFAMCRYPSELSDGQCQYVAVAHALTLDPEVIVLDEAVSALGVLVQNQILHLLNDLQAQLGLSYLFIIRDLAVARQIADDVAVMEKGRLVERNIANALFANPAQDYTRELTEAAPGHEIQLNLRFFTVLRDSFGINWERHVDFSCAVLLYTEALNFETSWGSTSKHCAHRA